MDNIILKDQDITTVRLSVWEQLREQVKTANIAIQQHEIENKQKDQTISFYAELLHIAMRSDNLPSLSKESEINGVLRKIESLGFQYQFSSAGVLVIAPK